MSDRLTNLIKAALNQARAENVTLGELLSDIASEYGTLGPNPFDAEGCSTPDADGFVQFRRVNDLIQELMANGNEAIVTGKHSNPNDLFQLFPRYACIPGLVQLEDSTDAYQAVTVDVTWASEPQATIDVQNSGRCFKFKHVKTKGGDRYKQIETSPGVFDYFPDARALSNKEDTVDKCVNLILKRVQDYMIQEKIPRTPDLFSPQLPNA